MLRTPVLVEQGKSPPLFRSIEEDLPSQIRWGSISSTLPVLSGPEQVRVYHDWIDAGRPHNIVCWECRLPDSLIGCQTCCRSYHTACLQDVVRSANNFHCPSCRARSWDHAPPQFSTLSPAPTSTRSATRSVRPLQTQDLPSTTGPTRDDESPRGSRRKSSGVPKMAHPTLNRLDKTNADSTPGLSPVTEMYPQLLEHLALPHDGTDQGAQSAQFKNQLSLAMQEIESHRVSMREKASLQQEYLRMQKENMQIKAYLDSGLSREATAVASPSTISHSITRPPVQRSGQSWDSIALDLI
ncbi:Zinc finger PHD-finger [Penicillium brevicompactum]|uniref:Zinc finger PHD-finger n=1 Tax=Penicillium brevicompactum TaxID=5074 RepID=A0A9W9UJS8_PENBR|nr:Zinc finger PHD-finger [Penicillium brevicompactum]